MSPVAGVVFRETDESREGLLVLSTSQPSLLFRSKGHRALGLVFLLALLPSGRCRLETPTREVTGLAIGDDLLRLGHQGRLGSWPLYGGDLAQTRFSPLRQINNTNVDRLVPRWVFHTEVYDDDTGYQTTPIVVDGEMYLTTPMVEGVQQDEGRSCLEILIFQILTKRSQTPQVQEKWGNLYQFIN